MDQVDWDKWFNQPGLAPVKGEYDTSLQDICTQLAKKWLTGNVADTTESDVSDFSSGQLQEFLDQLIMTDPLGNDLITKMEAKYPKISKSKNSEVRFRWIRVGLKARYKAAIRNALDMVTEQVRYYSII